MFVRQFGITEFKKIRTPPQPKSVCWLQSVESPARSFFSHSDTKHWPLFVSFSFCRATGSHNGVLSVCRFSHFIFLFFHFCHETVCMSSPSSVNIEITMLFHYTVCALFVGANCKVQGCAMINARKLFCSSVGSRRRFVRQQWWRKSRKWPKGIRFSFISVFCIVSLSAPHR